MEYEDNIDINWNNGQSDNEILLSKELTQSIAEETGVERFPYDIYAYAPKEGFIFAKLNMVKKMYVIKARYQKNYKRNRRNTYHVWAYADFDRIDTEPEDFPISGAIQLQIKLFDKFRLGYRMLDDGFDKSVIPVIIYATNRFYMVRIIKSISLYNELINLDEIKLLKKLFPREYIKYLKASLYRARYKKKSKTFIDNIKSDIHVFEQVVNKIKRN